MRFQTFVFCASLALAGCAEEKSPREQVDNLEYAAGDAAPAAEFGFYEAMETGPTIYGSGNEAARRAAAVVESGTSNASSDNAVTDTQIAYAYSWGFQVEANDLPTLQERHRALCQSLGDACRTLSLSQSGNDDYAYGRMEMQVAADRVEEFGQALNTATDGVDAEQISFGISGEDLTDDIIDTEARLAARRLLRDRLMEVLRTRQGSVGDLVEAERGVAEVNEEIDAATSRLENMRNRVAFSEVSIEYDPEMGQYTVGFWAPIAYAFGAIGSTLGVVIASLIYISVALIPISAFLFGLRWLWRRWRGREISKSAPTTEAP